MRSQSQIYNYNVELTFFAQHIKKDEVETLILNSGKKHSQSGKIYEIIVGRRKQVESVSKVGT